MPFTQQQAEEIKKQLFEQVDKMPNANKEQIKSYIEGLDEQGLEEFLKKNNLSVSESGNLEQASGEENNAEEKPQNTPQCVFCSIIKGEIPSYKLMENKKSLAILDINPVSKAHTIILPKDHIAIEKMPKTAMSLAQKIAKKIKKKFKADDIKIETSNFQGHAMINVIPLYKDTPLKKIKAEEKDLLKVQNKLEIKSRSKRKEKIVEKIKDDDSKLPRISRRIA